MIHCIGDSHVSVFSGIDSVKGADILPFFKTYRLGPHTAYNIMKRKDLIDGIIYSDLQHGDSIMFCFGEIDCRVHLLKQSEIQQKSVADIVQECVQRYFELFLHTKTHGYRLLAWNVPPSSRNDVIYGEYSTYGSCKTRNEISQLFNKELQNYCDKHGIIFVSIFDRLIDANGITNTDYYMDEIHLSQKTMPFILERLDHLEVLKDYAPYPEKDLFTFVNNKDSNFSLKTDFLRKIRDAFDSRIFVETGTYYGNTSVNAADIFSEVHTIELSQELYQQAIRRFESQKNVFLYQGDSGEIFPSLLKNLQGVIVFWLDGHFSGGITAKGEKNTPIIKELDAIRISGIDNAVILIDDIRNFDSPFKHASDSVASIQNYPSLKSLCEIIHTMNPAYRFAVIGDTIMAYFPRKGVSFSIIVESCTISRLYNGDNFTVKDVLNAEQNISQAEGLELTFLQSLHKIFQRDEKHGFCRHYRLWYALTLLGRKDFTNAVKEFLIASTLGFNHWRVQWYLAQASYGAGDFSMAIHALDIVLQSNSDFSPAKNLYDIISESRTPHAEINFDAKDEIDLAIQYCMARNFSNAEAHIHAALSKRTDIANIHCLYAKKLMEIDQPVLAEEHLQHAILHDPRYSQAYNILGVIYFRKKDMGKAMEMYITAFQMDNRNYTALSNLLRLSTKIGLSQQAAEILNEVMKQNGPNKELLNIANEFIQMQAHSK